ncbi:MULTISPECIES: TetR/AcrR family transcriptional regulator [unclassified Roseibium]|uniref:TetR/AcrR family transcriptional regulator n=1 Tax=unclassified Roseibium TaxID=2629323 RepID=UPI00273DB411|nr:MULTISPECIES: TetR/AcrR family transcriptional regulator [unclassified Roseibium]
MPRVSNEEKQRNHNKIVDAAARLFRENGIEMTSVADVMKAAGLTHGGFYRHFGSKEGLISAALDRAVDDVLKEGEEAPEGAARALARDAYIARYLSEDHLSGRGKGCPLAALGTELVRMNGAPQDAAKNAVDRTVRLLNLGEGKRGPKGQAVLALLLGSVVLARLTDGDDDKAKMLEAAKTAAALIEDAWPVETDANT